MTGSTSWFSVHVESRAPNGQQHTYVDDASADALMDLLEAYDGVVGNNDRQWTATISIEEPEPARAVAVAVALIESLAQRAGMPHWPLVRAEAVREDVLDEQNAQPTLPDLVSAPDAADILRISPQRLHELSGRPGFPKPIYELRTGKLWLRSAIETFDELWQRKPGRPGDAELTRQKVIGALVDSGITVAESNVFLGHDRTVILQLQASGPPRVRRVTAAKVINALRKAGLKVTDEATHSIEDIEDYLADGHTVAVVEMNE